MADTNNKRSKTQDLINSLTNILTNALPSITQQSVANIQSGLQQQNNLQGILQNIIQYQQNKSPWLQGMETFVNSLAAGLLRSANPNEAAFGQAIMGAGGFETPQERIQDKLYKQSMQTLEALNKSLSLQTGIMSTAVKTAGLQQQESWAEEFNPLKYQQLATKVKYEDDLLHTQLELLKTKIPYQEAQTERTKASTKYIESQTKQLETLLPLKEEQFKEAITKAQIYNKYLPDLLKSQILRNLSYSDYLKMHKAQLQYAMQKDKKQGAKNYEKYVFGLYATTNKQLVDAINNLNKIEGNIISTTHQIASLEQTLSYIAQEKGYKTIDDLYTAPDDEVPKEVKQMVNNYYKLRAFESGARQQQLKLRQEIESLKKQRESYMQTIQDLTGVDISLGAIPDTVFGSL